MTQPPAPDAPTPDRWNAEHYRERHAFVYESSRDLVSGWLDPQAGERVLDLGCGSGELTAQIAGTGAFVTGIDASPAMIGGARAQFAGRPGLSFGVLDAHDLTFEAKFDAVFSNAALHWMAPLPPVFAGVARALKPGGRLALEMGGAGNVQASIEAVAWACAQLGLDAPPLVWTFPSTGQLADLLEAAGLRVTRTYWFPRPSFLAGEDGFSAWLDGFGGDWLAPLSPQQRGDVKRLAAEHARPRLWTGEGWLSDYCRLRALAVRS